MSGSNKKYVAALDLGSNSFHLAIGELDDYGVLHTIERRKENVQLAAGLDKKNRLSDEAIAKAIRSIERFGQQMSYVPNEHRRVVATSTLRKAVNADMFCTKASDILKTEIDVISGIEEARLILFGVNRSIEPVNKPRVVIDIGGGSTEVAVSKGEEILFLDSFDVGCVSLTVANFSDGSYTKNQVDTAFYNAKLTFEGIQEILPVEKNYQLIGTSGTLKALARIVIALNFSPTGVLNQEVLKRLEKHWIKSNGVCDVAKSVVSARRVGVLPGGLAVIRAILKTAHLDELVICESALRDGVLHELASTPHPIGVRDRTIERLQVRSGVNQVYANQVAKTATLMLDRCHDKKLRKMHKLLDTAVQLHEIGILISHNNQAEHGAYMLKNGDLLGYDLMDQRIIGELVRQQRGKVDCDAITYQGINEEMFVTLLAILRVSIALHLGRKVENQPKLEVSLKNKQLTVGIDRDWLDDHPLSNVALIAIQSEFKNAPMEIQVNRI